MPQPPHVVSAVVEQLASFLCPVPQLAHPVQDDLPDCVWKSVPDVHATHCEWPAAACFQPAGHPLHAVLPSCSWYRPALHVAQLTFPCALWNCPLPQSAHAPVPLFPAAHVEHALLPPLTAHPAPDLHDVDVCELLSCHVLAGHAPQTTLLSASQAAVCLCPAPHAPQLLQLA